MLIHCMNYYFAIILWVGLGWVGLGWVKIFKYFWVGSRFFKFVWVGLGWVGLGQFVDGLGWVTKMYPWTTLD
jgi:hypothetical protein